MIQPPASPFAGSLPDWRRAQTAYAQQPLEFCPEFPRIAARHEAWWHYALEGPPLVLASTRIDPRIPGGKCLELLNQPERWMQTRLAQLQSTLLIGDTLPSIRVDYGPVCLGMLTGAQVEFFSETTWTHRYIQDDWSNQPDWQIHDANPWWQQLELLLKLSAENAAGRCLMMTPSLGGTGDLLLNTRGSGQLCMDMFDQPEKISAAVEAIYQAWQKGYARIWGIPLSYGVGLINFVGLWSDLPYYVGECDFNYLIGPKLFQQMFLPDIARQARAVGRSIFHLDGKGAAKHYHALLETPEISAIQYVSGAGNSALEHLKMLQSIQHQQRPLQVVVPVCEAVELSRCLEPQGLCLILEDFESLAQLQAVYTEICRPFARH